MISSAWAQVWVEALSAAGTIGAFAVGFVLLRQEHQREAARLEEDRRLQAVKVSAWVEAHTVAHGGRELLFHVHNASDMPIYEVSLPMPDADAGGEAEFIGLVPPGQTIQRPAPRAWLKTYYSPEPVQIEFLDSSGSQWTRDEQGTLNRDESPPPTIRAESTVGRASAWLRSRKPAGAISAQPQLSSGEPRPPASTEPESP